MIKSALGGVATARTDEIPAELALRRRRVRPRAASAGDADVARGLVAGERWAIRETWHRFAPMVLLNAERFLGSRTEAEDVVQDVLFGVFRKAKTLRDPGRLRSFIFGFTARALQSEMRRKRVRSRIVGTENAPDVPFRATDFESRDLLTRLFALLNRLRPRDRLIFVLRRMESMTVPEIAATMDISVSTVKRSLAHASSRMADWVDAEPGLAGLARGGRVRPPLRIAQAQDC